MKSRQALSVVLPTYNCAKLMERHLASMFGWLDLADEVIVVDSRSTDGKSSSSESVCVIQGYASSNATEVFTNPGMKGSPQRQASGSISAPPVIPSSATICYICWRQPSETVRTS